MIIVVTEATATRTKAMMMLKMMNNETICEKYPKSKGHY